MEISRRQLLSAATVAGLIVLPGMAPGAPAIAASRPGVSMRPPRAGFEGFGDPGLDKGFTALNINPSLPDNGVLSFKNNPRKPPSWQLAQWHSRHDLAGAKRVRVKRPYLRGGAFGFTNAGKTIAKAPDGSVLFEANGSQEYLATRTNEGWPHLIMQQSLPVQPYLDQISSVRYQMDVQIPYVTNKTNPPESYNPGIHAAALSSFFTIQNFNTASPDYNSYVWFSVPIADSRYPSPEIPSGAFIDGGTNSLIYGEPGSTYWSTDVKGGDWHHLDVDLYPILLKAFDTAQSMGVLTNSSLSEMQLTYYVLGWELPGTFDAAFQFNNLSVWIS